MVLRYGAEILMIFKNNNFIKLYIGLNIILFSLFVESKEFNYKFHWSYIPVAKLSVKFNESLSQYNANLYDVEFQIFTQGPLKLFRDYSSEGSLKSNSSESWDYNLYGHDRGELEEKSIRYFHYKPPVIKKFIDDAGVLPINIDPNMDKNAVDPFSVLFRTIEQLKSEQRCQNEYDVMDGKRRYKIIVELINEIKDVENYNNKNIIFYCKFTFSELQEEKNKWPFNRKDRYLDIWFSSDLNYKPVRFFSKTPIGSIVGKYISK